MRLRGGADCSVSTDCDGVDCGGNGVCVDGTEGDGRPPAPARRLSGDACDVAVVLGCVDWEACNYHPLATDDDGSCRVCGDLLRRAGACLNDADDDDVCDGLR